MAPQTLHDEGEEDGGGRATLQWSAGGHLAASIPVSSEHRDGAPKQPKTGDAGGERLAHRVMFVAINFVRQSIRRDLEILKWLERRLRLVRLRATVRRGRPGLPPSRSSVPDASGDGAIRTSPGHCERGGVKGLQTEMERTMTLFARWIGFSGLSVVTSSEAPAISAAATCRASIALMPQDCATS